MTEIQNGKGDNRRPADISKEEYDRNDEHAFRRRKKNDPVMKHKIKKGNQKEEE